MFGNNVLGIIFAYAHEERVRDLTELRVMASVPFGGRYRLVDFTLSNMVNSGLNKVGIITEDNYQSLMDHLGSGKAWDLSRKREGLYLLPPFGKSTSRTDGKIESLDSIRRFLKNSLEEYVILSVAIWSAISITARHWSSMCARTRTLRTFTAMALRRT